MTVATATTVPFVQFLRPDGRRINTEVDRDEAVAEKATVLRSRGCRFEIEELQTGVVSMTVERLDEVVSIRLADNGPEVLRAVDELVNEAYDRVVGAGGD